MRPFFPIYLFCDRATEIILYLMIIFSPWAFGTTQPWAIQTMNIAGYTLGGLLLIKLLLRMASSKSGMIQVLKGDFFTVSLTALTGLVITYVIVSAVNARATYSLFDKTFQYHDYISWLPHSYDKTGTWNGIYNYLALAFSFWAVYDWLNYLPDGDGKDVPGKGGPVKIPSRLRRLLWVISINGTALALEGLLQRIDGGGKLLWLVEPRINKTAEAQFGPYAYRGNAAALLNLIWPVVIGFWWILKRESQQQRKPLKLPNILLPCAILIAACPILSLSRGGAIIAFAAIIACSAVLLFAQKNGDWKRKGIILATALFTIGIGLYFSWDGLAKRWQDTMGKDPSSGRFVTYEAAGRMAQDYPVFGVGLNSYITMARFYSKNPNSWDATVHNDWLETRITLGWVGSSFVWLGLILIFLRSFFAGKIRVRFQFLAFFWISLGGCLANARFDFPFQIYSILFLFLVLSSVVFSLRLKTTS